MRQVNRKRKTAVGKMKTSTVVHGKERRGHGTLWRLERPVCVCVSCMRYCRFAPEHFGHGPI
jgi:hypothetical protein